MKRGFTVLALASSLGLLSSLPLRAEDQASPADLYKKKCSMCHKADGKGYASMKTPDFTSKEIEPQTIASLDILLDAGANVNAFVSDTQSRTARIARQSSLTDRLGQTALHQVAGRGWADVVAHLLQRGANPAAKDAMGRTPADLATTPVQGRPVPNGDRIAEMLKAAAPSH